MTEWDKNPQRKTSASNHCPADEEGSLSLSPQLLCRRQRLPGNEPSVNTGSSAGLEQPPLISTWDRQLLHRKHYPHSVWPKERLTSLCCGGGLGTQAFSSFSRVSNVTHPRRASPLLGSWQVLNSQLPSSLQITEASVTSCISSFQTTFELLIADMSTL